MKINSLGGRKPLDHFYFFQIASFQRRRALTAGNLLASPEPSLPPALCWSW